jgi:hypothetical protein
MLPRHGPSVTYAFGSEHPFAKNSIPDNVTLFHSLDTDVTRSTQSVALRYACHSEATRRDWSRARSCLALPSPFRKGSQLITQEVGLSWRRSRRCDINGCVEVSPLAAGVAVRDSTRPDGPVLSFSKRDWTGFIADLRAEHLLARR